MNSESRDGALPQITIVTPCLNGGRFIIEAIESIRRQQYPRLEHIVLDACSTDDTLALLARYPDITVISEPDLTAHHAMNKGIALAHGDVIGFLNVDDFYPDGVLVEVAGILAENPEIDFVIGHTVVFKDEQTYGRRVLFERTHAKGDGLWLPGLTFRSLALNGCFFRRAVFARIGNFATNYQFCADRQFLLRVVLAGLKGARIDRPTIWYRSHPDSRTFNEEKRSLRAISWEFFAMAWESAQLTKAAPDASRVFLAWHAFEGAKLILRSLLGGRIGEAWRVLIELSRRNPLWPIRLVQAVALVRSANKLFVFQSSQPLNDER
jgi:glycosyltransferase involved in cell wall biosynthesis